MARRSLQATVLLVVLCCAAFAAAPLDIWLDVPFVKQEKDGCGPASVAMVMQYWQQHRSAQALPTGDAARILRALPPHRLGVSASDMLSYFNRNGYHAFAYAGDWSDVEHQIEKGRPLIAALKPDTGGSLHYVVIAGVDDPHQLVLLNDPAQRKLLKEDRWQFEREWKATGFWTLLAVPAEASR